MMPFTQEQFFQIFSDYHSTLIVEGGLLILASIKGWFVFEEEDKLNLLLSRTLILYALIIYPLLGFLFGHAYPAGPILGLPCPSCTRKKIALQE